MCDRCAINPRTGRGSRRRRLWELPREGHCPVVGVCFPLTTLRQMVMKTQGVDPAADDYGVHEAAVAACRQRGPLAEQMQRELDNRHRPCNLVELMPRLQEHLTVKPKATV